MILSMATIFTNGKLLLLTANSPINEESYYWQ